MVTGKNAVDADVLFSFTSVITGVVAGVVVFFVRRLKPFIVAGKSSPRYRGAQQRNYYHALLVHHVID